MMQTLLIISVIAVAVASAQLKGNVVEASSFPFDSRSRVLQAVTTSPTTATEPPALSRGFDPGYEYG